MTSYWIKNIFNIAKLIFNNGDILYSNAQDLTSLTILLVVRLVIIYYERMEKGYSVQSNYTPSEPITCPICLNTVKDDVYNTECSHKFCVSCIDGWVKIKKNCPCCRKEITI
jgi:hypothetical protein